ncbi:hypothetical protein RI129_001372 [Pyrocoelia pectoralis]|uniref:Copper transport protein n=1 Tax=Pyrocoelia pectoralis TaxID=417401 RepID=A0AAN7VVC9_9COLE
MDHDMSHHHHPQDHQTYTHNDHISHTESPVIEHGDHGSNGHSMMGMAFHFRISETVLFDSWKFETVGGLIGSMIGIFFMAALYEGLKYYREYLFWKTYNALQYRAVTFPAEKGVVNEDNQVVHMVGEVIHKQPPTMLSVMHFFQTFLHIIQITLSYFLMLIFMTYNVWLCIAVVVGAAVGYFLFGWKKSVVVDVTEHCH